MLQLVLQAFTTLGVVSNGINSACRAASCNIRF